MTRFMMELIIQYYKLVEICSYSAFYITESSAHRNDGRLQLWSLIRTHSLEKVADKSRAYGRVAEV